MANITITLVEGSKFIGSPIVYRVVPTNVGSNAVFHRIRLTVNANVSGYNDASFEFSSPVENNGHVDFDISSALQAAAEVWQPTAAPGTYPAITYSLDGVEDYMIDGVLYEGRNGAHNTGDTVYMGTLTDYERMTGNRPVSYSRKPVQKDNCSPEVVFVGCEYLLAGSLSYPPSVQVQTVNEGVSTQRTYSIQKPRDGYEIRFINSLGVHESIHVIALRTVETTITTEKQIIARQETLTQFSRGVAIKQNNHEQWKMSSGPLDYAWASWFIHEFLMARWAWIKVGEHFIPCHIIPDETVPLIDRAKNDPIAIHFTVELDITGSPIA